MAGGGTTVSSGSFIDGDNPLSDNLSLFLIQLLIIITLSRVLAAGLQYLRQPPVIAEVIGGLILGPTALSSIPAFKDNVFPPASLPRLKLVADFGLVLYLFLVGMELDPVKVMKDFKKSASVSIAGIVMPFGLGVAVSKLIYDLYGDPKVPFTSFFVFCGVAMSITAFPVLARILASRKLMNTTVGQATLASAATDDAIAWCLLVLVVALINNPNNSINALYVFLIVVAYGIFLWVAIRPFLQWLVARSSKESGVSQLNVTILFLMLCASAWFTQAVGVHAIFGGFLMGLITPHEHGFAIAITEKLEDLVMILLLPLYFAYSGLNTRLQSLDDGTAWGIVVLVIVVACGGKIVGCSAAARLGGLPARESLTVGFLMNTKGLVELIVLNLGLQGGVITQKIFSIFVIMALVTTFMTVPIVSFIYPFRLYIKSEDEKMQDQHVKSLTLSTSDAEHVKLLVCLPSMRTVPAMMNLTQLMSSGKKTVDLFALRLIELGNRLSKLMMVQDSSETIHADPVMNVFRTFGQLNKQNVVTLLDIAEQSKFASNITNAAIEANADLIVLPVELNPTSYPNGWAAITAESLFKKARCTVAIFGERGFGVSSTSNIEAIGTAAPGHNQRILFPFFGTLDDIEVITLLASLSPKSISIQVIMMEAWHDALDALKTMPNVTIDPVVKEAAPLDRIKTAINSYSNKDLVVLGHETYAHFAEGKLKDFVDKDAHSSFMIIHACAADTKSV